ncbi:YeeE/YedE family protein [Massilia agilis]|uniref:YeeE/YedE family protein n=1 Tax=Massilia agilis TaxID=1811226 RepID=A0ABT2DAL6_9BURK|nr:YeeE/YedE family protein [Massilia agilis]MCS0808347.1 YeeE/YedE family protein [Massilia agilis]
MRYLKRAGWVAGALALAVAVTLAAGLRQGLLALIGIGFGAVLQGARFGFTTGWRNYIEKRDPQGLWAQMLVISLAAALTLPLLAAHPGELVGAVAPISFSLVLGAFLFGAAMQVADGCGSGTLYKAGSGAPVSFAVLPTFVIGSFVGASHQPAWLALGGLAPVDMLQFGWPAALAITVAGCAAVAWGAWAGGHKHRAAHKLLAAETRWARRWWLGALLLAILYALHLVVAGQPWGVVYGLGLWGAKAAQAVGWSAAGDAFWGVAPHADRLAAPILADVTSVTNVGLIYGALAASRWNGPPDVRVPSARRIAVAMVAGLVMGYSSRMAFGCNVGAFLDGITSASLHGWVWFALAFAGSLVGVRIRKQVMGAPA